MSPKPTTLDSLPAEMLELISDNLEPHDILTFRFVCTELQKAAFKAFSRTWFEHRTLQMSSQDSLCRSIAVADNATFGPLIQSITIFVDGYPPGSRAEKRAMLLRQIRFDFALLTTLFKKLQHLRVRAKVIVTTHAERQAHDSSHSTVEATIAPTPEGCVFFGTIMNAIKTADYTPRELACGSGTPLGQTCFLPLHILGIPRILRIFEQAFASVESMTLDLWIETGCYNRVIDLFQSVALFPKLRSLTIYGRDKDADEPLKELDADVHLLGTFLLQLNFPSLKTFKLWGCRMSAMDVVDFLRRHQHSYQLEDFHVGCPYWIWGGGYDDIGFRENVPGDEDGAEDVPQDLLVSGYKPSCKALQKMTGVQVHKFFDIWD